MRTIYKYPVALGYTQASIPATAPLVRFAAQDGKLFVWADIDTSERPTRRELAVYGTGAPIPMDAVYVGTCELGPFIWHLFELPKQPTGEPRG
jgi:hypothetical protein